MKVLKVTREISNAITKVEETFWHEWWFDKARCNYHNGSGNHCCEGYLQTVLDFDPQDLENELLECAEGDSDMQNTFAAMVTICRNKVDFGILALDDDELTDDWGQKYDAEEIEWALKCLKRYDKAKAKIYGEFYDIAHKYCLVMPPITNSSGVNSSSDSVCTYPKEIVSLFQTKDNCISFFEVDGQLNTTAWGKRFKKFRKKEHNKGDIKLIYNYLVSQSILRDKTYSTFQKATC